MTVNFAFFGYADVIECEKNLTISCERADYYSSHHQRVEKEARGFSLAWRKIPWLSLPWKNYIFALLFPDHRNSEEKVERT